MATTRAAALLATAFVLIQAQPGLSQSLRPKPRPIQTAALAPAVTPVPRPTVSAEAAPVEVAAPMPNAAPEAEAAAAGKPVEPEADPGRGSVTNLPLPRFVSLKNGEGNARRGPGLTHRIDWVFTQAGMPLKITAEYENWRRVEDADGLGGWVHYSLLSGTRSAIVKGDLVDFHTMARPDATIAFRAEAGVVARILSCQDDWCRVQIEGERGWAPIAALWGVEPGEVIE
ncbi:SH3 domain-containing protein [Thioclava sp. FR2]|uniref:SH3 domain-containing protein n=1 Tax=Thioclava sp. FR2 TaxID=3445780 RepID=UPI003EC100CC